MQAFHKLFNGKPNPTTMSAELNAQIITVRHNHTTPHHLKHNTQGIGVGVFKLCLNAFSPTPGPV